ncbi:MAG: LysR family transcriptional regulator [Bdellovibrionota bacterium]
MITELELQNFIELYTTQHMSRAAVRLRVTQPTLSQSLAKLEAKLKTKLFIRTKSGLLPTEEGQILYRSTKRLLEDWQTLNNDILKHKDEVQGRFRCGAHPAVAGYAFPPFLKGVEQHAPKLEFELVHNSSAKITEKLIAYEVDFAFVINPYHHPDLILYKICNDQFTFWKKKGLKNPPQRLFYNVNINQTELIMKKMKGKFDGWAQVNSASLEVIRAITIEGLGVGALPERIARAGGADDLEVYNSSFPAIEDKMYLAYRREILATRAGAKVIELAKKISF